MSDPTKFTFACIVEDDDIDSIFNVSAYKETKILELKELVYEKVKGGVFQSIDARDLVLLKVSSLVLLGVN
jgi:hypothetical protein